MYFIFILGAYNNAGLVPLANIITPGVPPPPPYTPNPVAAGKIRLFGVLKANTFLTLHSEGTDVWYGGVLTGSTAPEPADGAECDIQAPLERSLAHMQGFYVLVL